MDDEELKKKLFKELYKDVNGYKLSSLARSRLPYRTRAHVYGEVLLDSFIQILSVVKPKEGEVFYDLGSGTGRPLILASLFFPFRKLYGVEILKELCDESKKVLVRYEELKLRWNIATVQHIEFIRADFLTYDFFDADVVFINSTCFYEELFTQLELKCHRLKKGARVITLTHPFQSPFFTLLKQEVYKMSWGDVLVYFYEKAVD